MNGNQLRYLPLLGAFAAGVLLAWLWLRDGRTVGILADPLRHVAALEEKIDGRSGGIAALSGTELLLRQKGIAEDAFIATAKGDVEALERETAELKKKMEESDGMEETDGKEENLPDDDGALVARLRALLDGPRGR